MALWDCRTEGLVIGGPVGPMMGGGPVGPMMGGDSGRSSPMMSGGSRRF